MRAAAGASRNIRAAAGLALVLFLAGLTITGMLFLPTLVSKTSQRNNSREDAKLARLEEGFRDYVRLNQTIPGAATWATAISSVSGLNVTQVNCVFPDFPEDTSVQRVFVVDEFLGESTPLLPYAQSTNGLTGSSTNLLNVRARAMIVSSTKRGLSLPVSTGLITEANFDTIWNWTYNPATEAPPSGWPATWAGNGEFLHVKPLYLPNLFQTVTLNNLQYSLNGGGLVTVTSNTTAWFLRGGLLRVYTPEGQLHQARVILNDESFQFSSSTSSNVYYLSGNGIPTDTDGVPAAQLTNVAPTATSLPNYDSWRDSFAGLFLHKGGSGVSDSDPEKIQKWITAAGSISINGTVTLTLFSAMKDFDTSKHGQIRAYLVECDADGTSPTTIANVMVNRGDWDAGNVGTWIQDTISFGSVTRTISSTKRLGVFVTVHNGSGDDMWFAYGTTTYASRLTLP